MNRCLVDSRDWVEFVYCYVIDFVLRLGLEKLLKNLQLNLDVEVCWKTKLHEKH